MTKIEWTDETWNPVTGCTKISEGCKNCYAARMASRLAGRVGYPSAPHHFDVTLHPERLDIPRRWRKPRRVFVCSMSDLFHEHVALQFISRVFDIMESLPQHTFQVLTKRPKNMANYAQYRGSWPANVWAGVSVENQRRADERIPHLLRVPAAVRFLSLEPLLGPVTLWTEDDNLAYAYELIHWIIVGGESGPGARPMHPDWVRSLRDQSQAAGVPFFFKQWGAWFPRDQWEYNHNLILPDDDVYEYDHRTVILEDHTVMHRIGKRETGRKLDGEVWDEYPAAATASPHNK